MIRALIRYDVLGSLSGGKFPKRTDGVSIANRVYIGAQSIIGLGVTVGEMAVIGANSFVNWNVPERTVVGGSPAVPIARVAGESSNVRVVALKKE